MAPRTVAAVPSRFTMTIRSQSAPSSFSKGAGKSMPAAVTTASSVPPAPSTSRATAASAARGVGQVDDLVRHAVDRYAVERDRPAACGADGGDDGCAEAVGGAGDEDGAEGWGRGQGWTRRAAFLDEGGGGSPVR